MRPETLAILAPAILAPAILAPAILASVTCAALGCLAVPAAGQSINPALDPYRSETQAAAAITIPLGHSPDKAKTAPRLEIMTRNRLPQGSLTVTARDDQQRWQERRIGFTLDGAGQVMINGAALPDESAGPRDGISTLGAIGIGLGAVLVLSVITLADSVDALNDLAEPD